MSQKYNDGVHISQILTRTGCRQHGAEADQPCWDVYLDTTPDAGRAVCGERIRAAGFIGQVTETSVQSKNRLRKKETV